MLTCVEGQGTTARNIWYDPCDGLNNYSSGSSAKMKYISDTNGTGIRIDADGLLNNTLTCEDPYRLDACTWQNYEPKITLDEDFANQIAAEVAKKLSKQMDPLEKNADEVEIPPMSGFIEI